jgi:hypothetical protein
MKTAQRRNYACTPRCQASEFERPFNRFCAAVTEEKVIESFWCKVCKPFKEASTYIVVHDFWAGNELLRLAGKSSSYLWSSMAYIRYSIAASTIYVLPALIVP